MSELQQAINEMRNMRESYDQLGAAAEAYNTGKEELAQNITSKGVEASATETLPALARKVLDISQESYIIQGGEIYGNQLFGGPDAPKFWNLYEVLAQLLSDGRLVSYGGILLAEYYKGYDSLALSGAGAGGAYVVSDLDENGQFKMYTEDVTHIWATEFDGKGNRWVAYCFADEYHDFQITDTNTSPRSIFIGRKVGTITCLVSTRVSQIVVPDGNKLKDVKTNSVGFNWVGGTIVVENLDTVSDFVILENGQTENLYIQADKIESVSGLLYSSSRANGSIVNLIFVANEISKRLIYDYSKIGAVRNVIIASPKIKQNGYPTISDQNTYQYNCDYRVSVISEDAEVSFRDVRISFISLSYIDNDKTKSVYIINSYGASFALTDLQIQEGWCKPLNIAICANLTKENVQVHIFDKLGVNDLSTGAVTITLATAVLSLFTQEEIDAVVARTNITIVGA